MAKSHAQNPARADRLFLQQTMNFRLAVFTPQLGASFINRHVEDLLPGQTVAIAKSCDLAPGSFWQGACPVFHLDRWALSLPVRLARRVGVPGVRLRDAAVERFLRRHAVTVVLGEFLDQFIDFVPMLDRIELPYVVQGHGIDLSAALLSQEMADRYLNYRSARAVLTRSEFHRQRLIKLGLPADKIHVNLGGVDVPAQVPHRAPGAWKRFLAIGIMVPKKGPIYLLEAFRLAAAKDRDITLDIIGGGPLFPAVYQFVKACSLTDRVRLHGTASKETKERLLSECGVFVQHSIMDPETGNEEGLPAAIQEAMAHAMAVVSTRHAGIPEAVVEGETGLLVDEGDVEGMMTAMLEVTSAASVLGRAGYVQAAAKHSWDCEKSRLLHWLCGRGIAESGFESSKSDLVTMANV
jgi:glycosyltransferase involved in cell wall biosynthesis